MITSILRGKGGGYQVQTDGRTVWVNGPDGGSVARFNRSIDIHTTTNEQVEGSKSQCLFCTDTPNTKESWPLFVGKLKEFYGVSIPDTFRPCQSSP